MKRILFTHTDMDGAGCAIVFTLANVDIMEECSIIYCSNDNIDDQVQSAMESKLLDEVELIYFADICPTRKMLLTLVDVYKDKLRLVDHHMSNYYIKNSIMTDDKALITTEIVPGRPESGASLLYGFLYKNIERNVYNFDTDTPKYNIKLLYELIDTIRSYDTYEWKTTGNNKARYLNTLFRLIGMERFVSKYLDLIDRYPWDSNARRIPSSSSSNSEQIKLITDHDMIFISSSIEKEENAIDALTPEDVYSVDIVGMKAAVVFGPIFGGVNETAHRFLNKYNQFDIFLEINIRSGYWSFRSIDDKFDVSILAGVLGGGGHVRAAGAPIGDSIKEDVLNIFLKKLDY